MKSASRQKLSSGDKLQDVLKQNRRLGSGGVYSVCSAHPGVLEAAIQQAVEDNTIFLLESTSGQVNQEGGDTGQTPEEFAKSIRSAATQTQLEMPGTLLCGCPPVTEISNRTSTANRNCFLTVLRPQYSTGSRQVGLAPIC